MNTKDIKSKNPLFSYNVSAGIPPTELREITTGEALSILESEIGLLVGVDEWWEATPAMSGGFSQKWHGVQLPTGGTLMQDSRRGDAENMSDQDAQEAEMRKHLKTATWYTDAAVSRADHMALCHVSRVWVEPHPDDGYRIMGTGQADQEGTGRVYPGSFRVLDRYPLVLEFAADEATAQAKAAELAAHTVYWCCNCVTELQSAPAGADDEGLPLCPDCA